MAADDEDDDEEDDQQIKLDELLDNLVLDDAPDEPEEFIRFYTEGAKAAQDGLSYVPRDHANQIRDKETAVSISSFGKQFTAEDSDKKPSK